MLQHALTMAFHLACCVQRPPPDGGFTAKSYEPSDWLLLSPEDLKHRFVYLASAANEIHLAIEQLRRARRFNQSNGSIASLLLLLFSHGPRLSSPLSFEPSLFIQRSFKRFEKQLVRKDMFLWRNRNQIVFRLGFFMFPLTDMFHPSEVWVQSLNNDYLRQTEAINLISESTSVIVYHRWKKMEQLIERCMDVRAEKRSKTKDARDSRSRLWNGNRTNR